MKRRNTQIPLKYQIVLLVIITGNIAVLLTLLSTINVHKSIAQTDLSVDNYVTYILQSSGVEKNMSDIVLNTQNHILADKEEQKLRYEVLINENFDNLDFSLKKLRNIINAPEAVDTYNEIRFRFSDYWIITKEIITLSSSGKVEQAKQINAESFSQSYNLIRQLLSEMLSQNTLHTQEQILNVHASNKKTFLFLLIGVIVLVICAIVLSYRRANKLQHAINDVIDELVVLANGQISSVDLIEGEDEIGRIATNINKLKKHFVSIQSFVIEIGLNNYNSSFSPRSEKDVLSNTLIKLRDNLLEVRNEEEKRKIEDTQRSWTTEGLAKFAEILRHESDDLHELGANIIRNTVEYLKANQGGLFVLNESDKSETYLELVASYAYDRQKYIEKKIQLGEGLVGACVIEKNTRYLTEIPREYIKITSGLGEAIPKSLLIVPLKVEDQVLGALELASFRTFEPHEIDFTQRLAESIASTLATARINNRTALLLDESRNQSEALAKQEERMRHNLMVMQDAQVQANLRESELNNMLKAIDHTLIKGEYQPNGNLILANERYFNTMGYRMHEIKGKNIKMFIPAEELKEFIKTWQTVCEGNPIETIIRRRNKMGDLLWFQVSYTPVFNEANEVYKILVLAVNITQQKNKEKETAEKLDQITEQQRKGAVLLREAQKKAVDLSEKDSLLRRNLEEIQQQNKELVVKIDYLKQSENTDKKNYEKEIDQMWLKWNKHLQQASKLSAEINKLKETISLFEDNVQEHEKTPRVLIEQIQITDDLETIKQKYDKPYSEKIDNWLTNFINDSDEEKK